ncbi:SAC3 domain-containing protein 1 [Spea bombifrons]|uniref:SAC3 domain-containing protein 1 n=1 Tax=Spea bombifrons TaxID=233779 RepID=UPI0023492D75|nr:SAC3 domain-containing protein 1 [Spea bombifrons]
MNVSPPPPVGRCLDMCPMRECKEREQQGRLFRFETLVGEGNWARGRCKMRSLPLADPSKTVKEYSRPAAGKKLSSPCDLRPPSVLLKTVNYLLMEVWDHVNERDLASLAEAYIFVFDRLRAVRQDLTVQRIQGRLGAFVLEGSLGFLLCAPYLVRDLPSDSYDEVLHAKQVRDCFADLMECYGMDPKCPREAEFQALLLLYDLGNMDTINRALKLPRGVGDSPQVQIALAVNRAYLEGNWVRLFRLVHQLDCLQACSFYRHLPNARDNALRVLTHAYSSRNCRFPLDLLVVLLAIDTTGMASEMCRRRGLAVISGEKQSVVFFKASFKDSGPECAGREYILIETKRGDFTWAEIMMGENEGEFMRPKTN